MEWSTEGEFCVSRKDLERPDGFSLFPSPKSHRLPSAVDAIDSEGLRLKYSRLLAAIDAAHWVLQDSEATNRSKFFEDSALQIDYDCHMLRREEFVAIRGQEEIVRRYAKELDLSIPERLVVEKVFNNGAGRLLTIREVSWIDAMRKIRAEVAASLEELSPNRETDATEPDQCGAKSGAPTLEFTDEQLSDQSNWDVDKPKAFYEYAGLKRWEFYRIRKKNTRYWNEINGSIMIRCFMPWLETLKRRK